MEKLSPEDIMVNSARALGLVLINNLTQLNTISKLVPTAETITFKLFWRLAIHRSLQFLSYVSFGEAGGMGVSSRFLLCSPGWLYTHRCPASIPLPGVLMHSSTPRSDSCKFTFLHSLYLHDDETIKYNCRLDYMEKLFSVTCSQPCS